DLQFEKLPAPEKKPRWFKYDFDPQKEYFQIYIPKTYRPDHPSGVLGWANANDKSDAPRKFESLYDEFNLIVITAENCGNKKNADRRIGLLVSASLELAKTYSIDPKRRILSGFSGGGRVSALGCFVHPEFWSGVISWCG